jgi:hypothetical protein
MQIFEFEFKSFWPRVWPGLTGQATWRALNGSYHFGMASILSTWIMIRRSGEDEEETHRRGKSSTRLRHRRSSTVSFRRSAMMKEWRTTFRTASRSRWCGWRARALPGMTTRSGWRSSARRQDSGVLAPDALVTEEDLETVTEMRTGKRRRIGTKRGGGLPRLWGFVLGFFRRQRLNLVRNRRRLVAVLGRGRRGKRRGDSGEEEGAMRRLFWSQE